MTFMIPVVVKSLLTQLWREMPNDRSVAHFFQFLAKICLMNLAIIMLAEFGNKMGKCLLDIN